MGQVAAFESDQLLERCQGQGCNFRMHSKCVSSWGKQMLIVSEKFSHDPLDGVSGNGVLQEALRNNQSQSGALGIAGPLVIQDENGPSCDRPGS